MIQSPIDDHDRELRHDLALIQRRLVGRRTALVFGDNSSAQIAAMTPTYSGDITNGFSMAATIGIAT